MQRMRKIWSRIYAQKEIRVIRNNKKKIDNRHIKTMKCKMGRWETERDKAGEIHREQIM